MKKLFSALLSVAMLVSLAACGNDAGSAEPADAAAAPAAAEPADEGGDEAAPAGDASEVAEAPSGEAIKVGLIAMLTGANPLNGQRMEWAVQMAVDEVNAAGGLLGGRPVQLLVEDDQTLQDMAMTVANKLVSEGVAGVVGPHRSTNALAVESIAASSGVSFLTGGTTPSITTLDNDYLFRARASDVIFAQVAGTYAVEMLGAEKIGIFYNNDEFGTGAYEVLKDFCAENDIELVAEGHNTDDKDFTSQIMSMKNAEVDVAIIWTHDPELAIHARQIFELNLECDIVCSPGVTMPQVIEIAENEHIEGWYGVTDFVTTATTPAVLEFSERFEALYGEEADLYSAAYYGAAVVLLDAIERAGSDDPQAVRDALAATANLTVPTGTYTCDENNDLIHEIMVAQLNDGVPVYIETVSVG